MPRASSSRFVLTSRRARLAAVLPLGLLGAMLCAGSTPAHPSSSARAGYVGRTRSVGRAAAVGGPGLRVTEVEYRLGVSRGVVQAGPVRLAVTDGGLDSHDLHLRAVGSRQQIASPELAPGHRWDAVVDLQPGVYSLWCSLPEHARLGMHTTLRVVR